MIRLNITLPEEISEKLNSKKNKSKFIAEALSEKFIKEEKAKIELQLREGYSITSDEDKNITEDWEKSDLESWV